MNYKGNCVEDIKIAYIGGGSRQWGWGFISDLALAEDISGSVYLYDIDNKASKNNEIIGNMAGNAKGALSHWDYKVADNIDDALRNADFVIISILPGTFDEMESDVHTPEKYGIYQSVGDTTGPGGIIRALRTIPMYEFFANKIKEICPKAWVINYTNPMTVCTRTLYRVFPGIKAFGCCHEVFATQKILIEALRDIKGITNIPREDIKINVIGVNHFTWLTSAAYKNTDLYPIYREFADKYKDTGLINRKKEPWMNEFMGSDEMIHFDLFLRYGIIAAAGDRHLAEFCPGDWYLKDRETVKRWHFTLTPVSYRRKCLHEDRDERARRIISGEEKFVLEPTEEEGVQQIRALLGLRELVTNVNLPNRGQIPNLPYDAVVETNAVFRGNSVIPVEAGCVPMNIYPLISRIVGEQETIVEAGITKNLELAYQAFICDPLMRLSLDESKKLFDEMIENTKEYLTMYSI